MTVSLNGVAVDDRSRPTPELAAVRELLLQRAVVLGLLGKDGEDPASIDDAIERLLA